MSKTITQIVKIGMARQYEIYLDEEPSLTIHEDVLVKYGLHKGMEMEEAEWRDLLLAEEENKVRQAALRYLSYRPRTRKEIQEHLIAKDFSIDRIHPVLQELQDLGYVDDSAYAKSWVQERTRKGLGTFRIQQELKQKGIQEVDISHALAQTNLEEERQLAMEIAERRYLRIKHDPWQKVERKLGNYLLRRGFSWEIIGPILKELRNR
ncbi:RecX family transcriptional regulator [Risungbinella massiliensis]|uniref:RecX family transcriptional regulator n=1 Tax=Risungbinella massiliensis TaxID=1329796 RepID=UPI0005CB8E9E|nr:RecX family transcriptional regulator [Risungbinella massiliensis]